MYIYHAHTQFAGDRNWALTQVVATTGSPAAVEPAVRATIAAIDPQLVVYHPAPLTDVIGRGTAQRVFVLRLLTASPRSRSAWRRLGCSACSPTG